MANESDTDKEKLVNLHGLETFKSYADSYYTPKENLDAKQDKLTATGSASNPVYINSNGNPQAGNYIPSLNGSQQTSEASFYAPTSAGTNGQVLKSNGSGAPSWADNTMEEANVANRVANALTVEDVGTFDGSERLTIPLATDSQSGLMSAEDKKRLDSLWDAGELGDSLENTSWETIGAVARSGGAPNTWNIGDTKTITLSTGEEITVRIIGFNHDASNSITFEMVDCLSTTYAMNSSSTNAGGWDECVFRSTLNSTIFDTLPNDLQGVIRTVTKKATAGSQSSDIIESQDKLFLFACAELWSASALATWSSYNYGDEGEQYEYYRDTIGDQAPGSSCTDLVKYRNGSAVSWWLRTPNINGSTNFRHVYNNGNVNSNNASSSYSISFGFCV